MSLTKKEQVKKKVASGKLHLNFRFDSEITEEDAKAILKIIESIEEREKKERS